MIFVKVDKAILLTEIRWQYFLNKTTIYVDSNIPQINADFTPAKIYFFASRGNYVEKRFLIFSNPFDI